MTKLTLATSIVCAVAGCAESDSTSETVESAPQRLATNYTITVNADGSFSPQNTNLLEGDSVTFVGPGGAPLRRTDSIVQVNVGDITGNPGVACVPSSWPYAMTYDDPGQNNAITGPLRRGVSGIFALGPEDPTNWVEGPIADSCATIAAAAGIADVTGGELWTEQVGHDLKKCRKYIDKDGVAGFNPDTDKTTDTNSPYLLKSTWDNPDVAGAVIRINWRDFYTSSVSANGVTETITPNYTKLDVEMDNAWRRGKTVSLEVMAGAGIPAWIFNDYVGTCSGAGCTPPSVIDSSATGITAKSVIPIYTSDFGTNGSTSMPTANSCGYDKRMGSPADVAYKNAVLKILGDVATHIRAKSSYFQALGTLKVTGLNFLTGEMRLPKRCLDPDVTNANGNPQTTCWCNTRIWATPLGTQVASRVGAAGSGAMVNGGGYTYEAAQYFMNAVENKIYTELGRRKTMIYMLIQDGFPKVQDATHFDTDAPIPNPLIPGDTNLGYVGSNGSAIAFDKQTVDALNNGQYGNFISVNGDGSPNPVQLTPHPKGMLFVPMHAALSRMPAAGCPQVQPTAINLSTGKSEASLRLTGYSNTLSNANYGGPSSGCPNQWAVREGYQGQIIGFQNTNSLTGSDDLSSSLWNGTLNSNMVFLEVYENILWTAEQERRAGNTVLSTSAAGYASLPEQQKSLAQWADELHRRRRTIANANLSNIDVSDPFPDSYTFTFKAYYTPGQLGRVYFINPAAVCAAGATPHYGTVTITGI